MPKNYRLHFLNFTLFLHIQRTRPLEMVQIQLKQIHEDNNTVYSGIPNTYRCEEHHISTPAISTLDNMMQSCWNQFGLRYNILYLVIVNQQFSKNQMPLLFQSPYFLCHKGMEKGKEKEKGQGKGQQQPSQDLQVAVMFLSRHRRPGFTLF